MMYTRVPVLARNMQYPRMAHLLNAKGVIFDPPTIFKWEALQTDRQKDRQTNRQNAGTGTVKDVKSAMGKELYVNNYCLLYEGLIVIVIVNSRFVQPPRKQNNG